MAGYEEWIKQADMDTLTRILQLSTRRYEELNPNCEAVFLCLPQGPEREEILRNTVNFLLNHRREHLRGD